jgi:hypothetical protein
MRSWHNSAKINETSTFGQDEGDDEITFDDVDSDEESSEEDDVRGGLFSHLFEQHN